MANKLKLKKKQCSITIGALNTASTVSKHIVSTKIQSCNTNYERSLDFLTVPQISENVPDQIINKDNIKIPSTLKLADPYFDQPAPVDLLLGAGVTMSLFMQGQLELSKSGGPDLFLQKTQLGWVIGGSAPAKESTKQESCHLASDVQFNLEKFWEIEELPEISHLTVDEQACEDHFIQHVTRENTGRYVVALPFSKPADLLGESRLTAIKRLKAIERKLQQNQELKIQYNAVLQEYLDLEHMSEVPDKQLQEDGFYLPHHAVIKEDSQTTKVRVVFDGSAKGSNEHSLNEILHVGPTIQTDIFSLLLRFRLHQYILMGDIEKMYRQFLVRKQDRKYQRILWRNSDGIIKTYELNTVTFGLAPSPFLAIRCLHKLADDEQEDFPLASKVLKKDLYVDDLLTGTQTIQEAIQLRDELIPLLQRGMLNIRKWASNEPQLLQGLPEANKNIQLQLDECSTIKTLGVYWKSNTDTIVYTVKTTSFDTFTKRKIFSEIGNIFDPLGLLGPVVMTAKIIMQQLWQIKSGWDDIVPISIQNEWLTFYQQLPMLNELSFTRHTIIKNAKNIQLHGFCDASEKAYGACIYLRSVDPHSRVLTQILCAKGRIAPLKTISIPRLELCGALLLATLYKTIIKSINIDIHETTFWSDSTIVLHWLKKEPTTMKTFVANRVAKIQQMTNPVQWRHVRTHDNPADIISRGQLPADFIQTKIWQQGPTWLCEEATTWPTFQLTEGDIIPELKVSCHSTNIAQQKVTTNKQNYEILNNYSTFTKLQRIIAYCLRFKTNNKNKGYLKIEELENATHTIIKLVQKEIFFSELKNLSNDKQLNPTSKIFKLNPFIDSNGLLRVGGRLQNASIPYNQKFPLILPKDHYVTKLIIIHIHKTNFHAGTQATLYAIRQNYWPIDGRNQIGKIIKSCTTCLRAKPRTIDYLMGNLPKARVNEAIPFTMVGVDFCGPFLVKEKKERNRMKVKVYVAVFVCLAIKAVHLEMVSDLTADGFIAALRRFISRRGHPTDIYSDNGLNFQGANNELINLQKQLNNNEAQQKLQEFFNPRKIQWHFTPPLSPHFGGLWEAAVKSFKHHFKRVIKPDMLLSQEEFNTLIIEIEAILNSRPLTPVSTDPNDLMVLSPGHFLIGHALTSIRDHDYTHTPMNRLSRWQLIEQIRQEFWQRWHKEYLNEMINRSKWNKDNNNINKGDIVLLKEDNIPPMHWALGRIIDTHPGTDGIVRAVTVKTAKSTYKRNVKKLAPLVPCDPE